MKKPPKDQVTTPQEIPDPAVVETPPRGVKVVAALRGRAKRGMTTDEIMKLTRA